MQELAAVLLDEVDPPVVADGVGDPGADDVGGRGHEHRRPERVVAARDVEAREEHRRLARDRDAGALEHHQQEDAGEAEVAHDVRRELDELVGDRGVHEERREHGAVEGTGYGSAPWPSRCSTRARPCSRSTPSSAPPWGGCSTTARSSSGPRSGPSRRSSRRRSARGTRSAWPTGPRPSPSPCGRWGSGRATRSSCPRSRSTPAPRRSRTPAPGPCSATSTPATSVSTPEMVRAVLTPRTKAVIVVHLFGNVAPVREIEALGRPGRRGRRAGGRLPGAGRAARRAGHRRDVLLLPVEEPRRVRRRRRHHDARRRRRRPRPDAALPRLARQGHLPARWATTRAWTSCRRRSSACSSRTSTTGPRTGRRSAAGTPRPGWATSSRCPSRRRARRRRGTCTCRASERADELLAGLQAAGIGARPYYRVPIHRQPAMASYVQDGEPDLPGTEEAARTHLALPISAVLTREQVDEVVSAVRRCASGST